METGAHPHACVWNPACSTRIDGLDRVLADAVGGADEAAVAGVEADRDANVALVGAEAGGRVEGDPAEPRHVRLGPGVRARLAARLFGRRDSR